ncbi:carboxypeptidase regulatory-like domain-containing protein, partial [bacterium]
DGRVLLWQVQCTKKYFFYKPFHFVQDDLVSRPVLCLMRKYLCDSNLPEKGYVYMGYLYLDNGYDLTKPITITLAKRVIDAVFIPGDDGRTGIQGTVRSESTGKPVKGAHVYAYVDYSKNLIGVADYVSRGSDDDGSYQLEVPAGEYYVVARRRASGSNYGPIVSGDLYDHRFGEKEVSVSAGRINNMDFSLVEMKEPLFFQVFTEQERRTDTLVKGHIVNESGTPVQGAFATAYINEDMKRLPDFASTLTGDDGSYTLYLPSGGRYFIGARVHARSVPKPGEPVGRYIGSEDHSITIEDGASLEGIDMTVHPFTSEVPTGYKPY